MQSSTTKETYVFFDKFNDTKRYYIEDWKIKYQFMVLRSLKVSIIFTWVGNCLCDIRLRKETHQH